MPRRKRRQRRARGTGGLSYRRTDHRFEATLPPDDTGHVASRYFPSGPTDEARDRARAEAEAWLATQIEARRQGGRVDPDETLGQYLDRYYDAMAPVWPASSGRAHRQRLQRFAPIFGARLAALRTDQIQTTVAALIRRGLAPRTVVATVSALRTALDVAIDWELITRNPAKRLKLPELPTAPALCWSAAEARRFLGAARGTRFEVAWRLAAELGLRHGELRALAWDDIDEARGMIHVRRGEDEFGTIGPTKGRRGRSLAATPSLMAALRRHRDTQPPGTPWVLGRGPGGSRWSDSTLLKAFTDLARVAGVPHAKIHGLRHFSATMLLRGGLSGAAVAERLGHASPATTHQFYDHVDPAERGRAAELMAEILEDDAPENLNPSRSPSGARTPLDSEG